MKACGKFLIISILLFSNHLAQFNEYHPEFEWRTLKTKHSEVHFHPEAQRTAQVVAKIIEDIWEPITELYNYEPETIHFVIKDIDDFSNGATYFFDNKIEIWSSSLNFELRGTHNWLRNVISHEFTHMVQIQAGIRFSRRVPAFFLQFLNYEDIRRPDVLYGFPNFIASYPIAGINIPAWFAEGTAQYMRREFEYDTWDSHRDMILRSYVLDDNMLSYNQMGVFSKNSLGSESVYNSGYSLTRFIAAKYGENKIGLLSKSLGKTFNFTFDSACEDVLGISGKELYNEWKSYLKKSYESRTKNIKENLAAGEIIRGEGFSNHYPTQIGNKLFYVSNKGYDYLGLSSVYSFDLDTQVEEHLVSRVNSSIAFIDKGKKIIYSRLDDDNERQRKIHDLYSFNITSKEEKRLTYGLRANNPSVSHDGKSIVFVFQNDGTTNLGMVDVDGKNFRSLTNFKNGEQVYNPKFSHDDKNIIFGYSKESSRDICTIAIGEKQFDFLLAEKFDERNPFILDAAKILFSSDETGIFNIYEYNFETKEKKQLTNVLGGAFMPFVSDSQLFYTGYTSRGYKIFKKDFSNTTVIDRKDNYEQESNYSIAGINFHDVPKNQDIKSLRNFNDDVENVAASKPYSAVSNGMSIFPFLRWDNYSTANKGIEKLKPGLMITTTDMLNKYSLFAGGAINTRLERDLFLTFDYKNKLPWLYSIGLKPDLSLSLYSVSRKTDSELLIDPLDPNSNIDVDVIYNLFEVDFNAKHRFLTAGSNIEFKYSFSRYVATIGSFTIPNTNSLAPATDDTYLIGHNFEFKYLFKSILPSVDRDINPIGREVEIKVNHEINRFNPEREYEVDGGFIKPVYTNFDFQRVELNWHEYIQTVKDHTLNLKLRAATILGPEVPDFFDYYLGGLIGMKSYPFYSISGNNLAWLHASYRFPVLKNIDLQLGHMYFDKLYFSLYGDYGNAWTENKIDFKNFKKGAGAEVRLKMISYYVFPTSIFFSAAYSFDKFSRTVNDEVINYGKEWRLYGGILFEFNF